MYRNFILVIIVLNYISGNAQDLPDDVKSPTAESYEKYGAFPVNCSTGSIDITIPLHSSSSPGFKLDLAVTYDASGLVISSGPGIVGMNWSVLGIGSISRSVNSHPDEWFQGSPNPQARPHYYTYDIMNAIYSSVDTDSELETFHQAHFDTPGYAELDPDVFTFNFLGKTGKFFRGADGHWKVQSESNLEVTINESDFFYPFNVQTSTNPYMIMSPGMPQDNQPQKTIGKITIRDDAGYTYIFGASQNAIEFSGINFFSQNSSTALASTWYLETVKNRYGAVVCTYTYTRGTPIASFSPSLNRYTTTYFWDDVSGNLIFPTYLSSITTNGETLAFSYADTNCLTFKNEQLLANKFSETMLNNNPNGGSFFGLYLTDYLQHSAHTYSDWNSFIDPMKWKKLTGINIYRGVILDKKILFEFEDNPMERLFLKKIKIQGVTNGIVDTSSDYSFFYSSGGNGEYSYNGSLPGYLYPGIDFMGYYNGASPMSGSYTDIDDYINDLYTVTNTSSDTAGTLRRVVYPTKGETIFEFEKHTFSKYMDLDANQKIYLQPTGTNFFGSGLRIKKVTSTAGPDQPAQITKYSYTTNVNSTESSGYFSYPQKGTVVRYDPVAGKIDIGSRYKLTKRYGPPVRYSKVFERKYLPGGATTTEYDYSDPTMFTTHKAWVSKYSKIGTLDLLAKIGCTDYSGFYGKLTSRKDFDAEGNLVKTTLYTYRNPAELESAVVYSLCYKFTFPDVVTKLYYGDYDLVKETTIDYFGSDYITTENYITKSDYPNSFLSGVPRYSGSRRETGNNTTSSTGETLATSISYKFNCTTGDCFQDPFSLVAASSKTRAGNPVSQTKLTYNAFGTGYNVSKVETIKGTETTGTSILFTQYDSVGNVLSYQKDTSGPATNYIYGYSGQRIVAKIEGVPYSLVSPYVSNIQVLATSYYGPLGEAGNVQKELDLRAGLNALRAALPNAMVTTYTYDAHQRLFSLTAPNGRSEFYYYDGLDRLLKIVDEDGNILNMLEYNLKN